MQKISDFGWKIDYLKKLNALVLEEERQKQKAQVVQELRQKYPLKALLQLAGLPRSTFYYYLHQSQNPAKYQMVKEQIVIIFNENKNDTDTAESQKNCITTIFV